jgi:hypothetical protein
MLLNPRNQSLKKEDEESSLFGEHKGRHSLPKGRHFLKVAIFMKWNDPPS